MLCIVIRVSQCAWITCCSWIHKCLNKTVFLMGKKQQVQQKAIIILSLFIPVVLFLKLINAEKHSVLYSLNCSNTKIREKNIQLLAWKNKIFKSTASDLKNGRKLIQCEPSSPPSSDLHHHELFIWSHLALTKGKVCTVNVSRERLYVCIHLFPSPTWVGDLSPWRIHLKCTRMIPLYYLPPISAKVVGGGSNLK